MRFFQKRNASQKLWLASGSWLEFETAPDGSGLLACNNPAILVEIDKAIKAGRGIAWEITQGQYEEVKKKIPTTSSKKWRDEYDLGKVLTQKIRNLQTPPRSMHPGAENGVAEPSKPPPVPQFEPVQGDQVPRPTALPPNVE